MTQDRPPRGAERAASPDLLPSLRDPVAGQSDDSERGDDEQRRTHRDQEYDQPVIAAVSLGAELAHGFAANDPIAVELREPDLGRSHDGITLSGLGTYHVVDGFTDRSVRRQRGVLHERLGLALIEERCL